MSTRIVSEPQADRCYFRVRLAPPLTQTVRITIGKKTNTYIQVLGNGKMRQERYTPAPEPDSGYDTHRRAPTTRRTPPKNAFEAGDSGDEYGSTPKEDNPKLDAIRQHLDEFGRYHPKDGSKPLAKPLHIWHAFCRDGVKIGATPELIEQAQPTGFSELLRTKK